MKEWGYACDVIAPSLIPKRPGVKRKHDKYDAAELARLYRAGELTAVRIPSESDERVREVVRCRETFQKEILKSRHYILRFLAKRGFVFREGTKKAVTTFSGETITHRASPGNEKEPPPHEEDHHSRRGVKYFREPGDSNAWRLAGHSERRAQ